MPELKNIPKHVAIIMDGNGRWAKKRGLPAVVGHNAGMKAMKKIVRCASNMGISYLTVYAFSTENWKRTAEEVTGIFKLLVKYVNSDLQELSKENVRVRILGDYEELPDYALGKLRETISETKDNTGMQFNIAINYGSRVEIVRAMNKAVKENIEKGKKEIDESDLEKNLYTGEENDFIPDPDVVIRTSGEERLSNFLLWQTAYSELMFTKTLWPDFTPEEFSEMIESYSRRDRRFGGRQK